MHEEITELFQEFNRDIKIIKLPLYDIHGVFQKSSNSVDNSIPLVIPDPQLNFWQCPSKNSKKLPSLPKSFHWLLDTLCRICETSEMDIFLQYCYLERSFISVFKSKS